MMIANAIGLRVARVSSRLADSIEANATQANSREAIKPTVARLSECRCAIELTHTGMMVELRKPKAYGNDKGMPLSQLLRAMLFPD